MIFSATALVLHKPFVINILSFVFFIFRRKSPLENAFNCRNKRLSGGRSLSCQNVLDAQVEPGKAPFNVFCFIAISNFKTEHKPSAAGSTWPGRNIYLL